MTLPEDELTTRHADYHVPIYGPNPDSPLRTHRLLYQVPNLKWMDSSNGLTHTFDLFSSREMMTSEDIIDDERIAMSLIRLIEEQHTVPYKASGDLFRIHIWRIRCAASFDFMTREAYSFMCTLAQERKRLAFVAADGGTLKTPEGPKFILGAKNRYAHVQHVIDELSEMTDEGNIYRYHGIYFISCNPDNLPIVSQRIPTVIHTDANNPSTGYARLYYPERSSP
jgi:hypothetical protein